MPCLSLDNEDDDYPHPGPIDNRKILVAPHNDYQDENPNLDDKAWYQNQEQLFVRALAAHGCREHVLRPDLVEGRDYEVLSREQWSLVVGWYGGGPSVERHVVRRVYHGLNANCSRLMLELHPLQMWVRRESDPRRRLPILVNRCGDDLCGMSWFRDHAIRALKTFDPAAAPLPDSTPVQLIIETKGVQLDDYSIISIRDQDTPYLID